MLKISLSAGHGLHTLGKETPDGMKEWEFNAGVVKHMMALLASYEGVALTRLDDPTGKVDISLKERTAKSDAFGANVHIDAHANAFGSGWNDASGIETFIKPNFSRESNELASVVQLKLIKATGLTNRGVKTGNLHMVREPNAKAKILVELGFMTNKKEAALLKTDAYRKLCANAIVDALVQVYNLKKRPVKTPSKGYYVKTGSFPTKEAAEAFAKTLKVKTHVMEVE